MVWLFPFLLGVAYAVCGIVMSDKQALINANIWMAAAYIVARK